MVLGAWLRQLARRDPGTRGNAETLGAVGCKPDGRRDALAGVECRAFLLALAQRLPQARRRLAWGAAGSARTGALGQNTGAGRLATQAARRSKIVAMSHHQGLPASRRLIPFACAGDAASMHMHTTYPGAGGVDHKDLDRQIAEMRRGGDAMTSSSYLRAARALRIIMSDARRRRALLLRLLVIAGAVCAAAPASAGADQLGVDFESGPPLRTPVRDDYAASAFVRFPKDPGFRPYRTDVGATVAHSERSSPMSAPTSACWRATTAWTASSRRAAPPGS
jgi:hypothetical protein